MVFVIGF